MTDCHLIVLDTAYFIVAVSLKWLISIVVLQCGLIDLISMVCLIIFSTDNWNRFSILSQGKSSLSASKTESSIESCQDLESFSLFLSTLVSFSVLMVFPFSSLQVRYVQLPKLATFVQRFLSFLATFSIHILTTLVQILPFLAIIWLKFLPFLAIYFLYRGQVVQILPFLAIIWFISYIEDSLSKHCCFRQYYLDKLSPI